MTRRIPGTVIASALLAAIGCSSGNKKPEKAPEAPTPVPAPAPAPAVDIPAAISGHWTRASDGAVFDVADDGSTVHGKLASDPKGTYDEFAFVLERKDGDLVGTATFKPKGGATIETAWHLKGDSLDKVVGDNEVVSLDPDTGEVADFLGRRHESQPFAIEHMDLAAVQSEMAKPPETTEPKPGEPTVPGTEPKPPETAPTKPEPPATVIPEKICATPDELLHVIFDALRAGDKDGLKAVTPTMDECVKIIGPKAKAMRAAVLNRIDADFARFAKGEPEFSKALYSDAQIPPPVERKAETDPKAAADLASVMVIKTPVFIFELNGVKKGVKLTEFIKVGDGGWKIISLLPARK